MNRWRPGVLILWWVRVGFYFLKSGIVMYEKLNLLKLTSLSDVHWCSSGMHYRQITCSLTCTQYDLSIYHRWSCCNPICLFTKVMG